MIKKLSFDNLMLETTRRCNLSCAHCMRGDAQNIDISHDVINALLDRTEELGDLGLTGGEPSLNISILIYLLEQLQQRKIPLYSLTMVLNGVLLEKKFCDVLNDYNDYIKQCHSNTHDRVCIGISKDIYHDNDVEKAMQFYKANCKADTKIEVHELPINLVSNLGRAKNLSNAIYVPKIKQTKIAMLEKGKPCFCKDAINYKLKYDNQIIVLCHIEVTVNGDILQESMNEYEEEDNKKNHVSTVYSDNIYNDILKYNWDEKFQCSKMTCY